MNNLITNSTATNNNEIKRKIIEYIEYNYNHDKYYFNIFLLIKLQYLKFANNNINDSQIPKKVIDIFNNEPQNLKLIQILLGYSNNEKEEDLLFEENRIIIPADIITNYFRLHSTKCNDEHKYITNKIDLYISILTYIYYKNYLSKLNTDFHKRITIAIFWEIDKNNNLSSLCNSTIYDFTDIPNTIQMFIYNYNEINNSIGKHHHKMINNNNNNNNNNDLIIQHHLKIIHKFYNEYILSYLIHSYKSYKQHPLIENDLSKSLIYTNSCV